MKFGVKGCIFASSVSFLAVRWDEEYSSVGELDVDDYWTVSTKGKKFDLK